MIVLLKFHSHFAIPQDNSLLWNLFLSVHILCMSNLFFAFLLFFPILFEVSLKAEVRL